MLKCENRRLKTYLLALASGLVGFAERKDNSRRRKVTLNSLRRFVETTVSDSASKDYAEWFLGHRKSPYWTRKEQEKREIYATKCMKYLTFLDYTMLEVRGKNNEANLQGAGRTN